MTDLPPSPDTEPSKPAQEETSAPASKAKKRKKPLLRRIAVYGGVGVAALIGVAVVAVVGARYYVTTEAGRNQIVSAVDGMKIGRFGTLGIENLQGDILKDASLGRLTISDQQGVWLEAKDVQLDWKYGALFARRFHAENIQAKSIHLIRQPVLEEEDEPGGPQPISIEIDRFAADVELMEDFSKEYGHWRLNGSLVLPRSGNKDIKIDAASLSRPGDFLKAEAILSDKPEDLRLNLQAQEARGGPLAGSLGYSPDQPFSAVGVIDGRNVNLEMTTGQFRPLRVHGQFSQQNSYMSGYADFSGSTLMEPFVQRFGRTARIGLAGAPDSKREGYQAMAWKLVADNITTTASGYVRVKDGTYADNIKLMVNTPSLSRLVGAEVGDASSYEGVFKGDASTFSLTGKVDVANGNVAQYRLARLTGPLSLEAKDGAYSLKGELAGQGGSTNGLIGGLLGRTPRLDLTLSRLKDGNILLQDVDLTGSALSLTGSGRRNLLGGLSFAADFDLNDVSVIRAGAKGRYSGKLTGNMARSGAGWSLDLDSRARDLLLGIEQIDRLLGRQPTLDLKGSLNKGTINISDGRLRGIGENRLNGQGVIRGGQLDLDLNWNALGPFFLGPIAIDGNMQGGGTLAGSLNTPVINLTSDFDRLAVGQMILDRAKLALQYNTAADAPRSSFNLTGSHRGQPAYGRARFEVAKDLIILQDVDINAGGIEAQGSITLADMFPRSADLQFSARQGAFLQRGFARGTIRIPADAGPDSMAIALTGNDLIVRGTNLHFKQIALNGTGTTQNLPLTARFSTSGDSPMSFDGQLVYSQPQTGSAGLTHRLEAVGTGRFRDMQPQLLTGTYFEKGPTQTKAELKLGFGNGRADVVLLPEEGGRWKGDAVLTNVPLRALNPELQGTMSGTANLANTGAPNLSGRADITFAEVGSQGSRQNIDGQLRAILNGNSMQILSCAYYSRTQCNLDTLATIGEPPTVPQQAMMLANITMPMVNQASPAKLVSDTKRPIDGWLRIDGEVEPLFNMVDGIDRKLRGDLDATIKLGGTLDRLTMDGAVTLKKGHFIEGSSGLTLPNLELDAAFNTNGILLKTLSSHHGNNPNSGSRLSGSGVLSFTDRPISALGFTRADGSNLDGDSLGNLTLQLYDFPMVDNETADIRASGTVQAVRTANLVRLNGELTVNNAEIRTNSLPSSSGIVRMPVTDRNAPPRRAAPPQRRSSALPLLSTPIELNVSLDAKRIEVTGRGLDLLLSSKARITGNIAEPRLTGTAEVERGDYDFAGKRFVFDDDGKVTLSTDPSRIRLDLRATREDASLTAIIRVTGTAAEPRISLTAEPEMPQDEILSQVLFGRSVSQLSALEAAQLASGVASLAGGGGLDVIGGIRELARLDRLSFSGEASNMTIAGGRRLSDNLYLEIIGGGESGTAVRVEWQVRREIAVTSTFSGDNKSNVAIRWRRAKD